MIYVLGKIAMTPKGTYSTSSPYTLLDFVVYNGSSYVAKQTVPPNTPPTNALGVINSTYWQLLAAKGETVLTLTQQQINDVIDAVNQQNIYVRRDQYVESQNDFTDEYMQKIDNIGDATITIKKNGNTVGTFSTNSNQNQIIDIAVPTEISELSGYVAPLEKTVVQLDDISTTVDITTQKPGVAYVYKTPVDSVKITLAKDNGDYSVPEVKNLDRFSEQPIYVHFVAADDFDISLPNTILIEDDGDVHISRGEIVNLTLYAGMLNIKRYRQIRTNE